MTASSPNFEPGELITSKLRWYSYGILAANKALKSMDIEVAPMEELPMLDGELTDLQSTYSAQAKDAHGQAYSVSVATSATIKATWLRFGDANRMTAPDVRKGEAVMIYQFGDAKRYYWMTLKQDAGLRKLETVVWAISATRDEGVPTSADSTYYVEFSSHQKIVHLHTSKADGEPFSYDIQLDTKNGSFTVMDDAGNYWRVDSANARLEMKNSEGTHVDMDRKKITLTASESVVVNATRFEVNAATTVSSTLGVNGQTTLSGGLSSSGGSGNQLAGGLNADTVSVQQTLTVEGYAQLNGGTNIG